MKGIKNDFSLVQDGIEIRYEQPKKWKKQDKKIHISTKKLRYERFSVFEFLLYTRHTTPNFGMDRSTNNSFGKDHYLNFNKLNIICIFIYKLFIEEIEEHNITTYVIHRPDASLPTSSLLIGSDVEVSTANATWTPNHMDRLSFNVAEDIQNLNTSPFNNSSFGSDVEVSTANATSTPNHMAQISFNVEEDIQNLNTSPLINSSLALM